MDAVVAFLRQTLCWNFFGEKSIFALDGRVNIFFVEIHDNNFGRCRARLGRVNVLQAGQRIQEQKAFVLELVREIARTRNWDFCFIGHLQLSIITRNKGRQQR